MYSQRNTKWVEIQTICRCDRKSTIFSTEMNESKQKHFSHENDNQNDNCYGMRWWSALILLQDYMNELDGIKRIKNERRTINENTKSYTVKTEQ